MSKIITFSRKFPAYHPKAGQPTHFVEKLWLSVGLKDWKSDIELLNQQFGPFDIDDSGPVLNALGNEIIDYIGPAKHHTIRSGNRWKAGDKFSPRVWSGKPYNSPMITIAPDIEIVKVWDVEVDEDGCLWVYCERDGEFILDEVARNDGLSREDLMAWFEKPMTGQIICWSNKVSY